MFSLRYHDDTQVGLERLECTSLSARFQRQDRDVYSTTLDVQRLESEGFMRFCKRNMISQMMRKRVLQVVNHNKVIRPTLGNDQA